MQRQRQLNIRLNEEEARRVDQLASHYELTVAGLTRMLWKREHEALRRARALPDSEKPPKTAPKTAPKQKGRKR